MREFSISCKLMGKGFELVVVQPNEASATELLRIGIDEIRRIENLLSEFIPTSETSLLNQFAGNKAVTISPESFELIERCLNISKLTSGCFDISTSPLKKLYSFTNAEFSFPDDELIQLTLKKTGYRKIIPDKKNHSISFSHPNLAISFAAVGKGYAADRVKQLWTNLGVKSGYINASGDLTAFGTKPNGEKWKIGISNPENRSKILMYIPLTNAAVATSGDYEQFFMHNNIRFSHTIHPFTGKPMQGLKSVSVFSPSAELSDALATALFVMGVREGIRFINQLPHTHCIFIDFEDKIHFSKNLQYEEIPA